MKKNILVLGLKTFGMSIVKQLSKYNSVSYPGCFDLFSTFESKYAILMMRAERIKK